MTTGFYAVIMAGGGGTRLWPLSRQDTPKQMLPLVGDRSLFQIAVDRLKGVFTPERIFVVTVADQAEKLGAQCPHIPRENFFDRADAPRDRCCCRIGRRGSQTARSSSGDGCVDG